MMKFFAALFLTLCLVLIGFTVPAHADTKSDICGQVDQSVANGDCAGGDTLLLTVAKNGLQAFVVVVGMISVLMIVIGGFRYALSGGDPQATQGAKNTILYAVIGLVVAILAQSIVTFVLGKLG